MGVQTVKFKGEFDVSQIMNSIKQMRAELAKQGNSSLFGNLDKEISKIEGLGSTIQAQIGKGFASTKEFKTFEANISKLELEFQKLGQSFDSINGDNLKIALKNLDKQVDGMKKKANEMAAAFKTSFSTETSGIGEKARSLTREITEMAKAGKSYEEAQKRIKQYYGEELRQKRESIELTKQEIAALEGKTFNVPKSSFQKRQFTFNGSDIDSAQLAKVNAAYEKSIRGTSTGPQAASAFKKELESLNIVMKNQNLVLGRLKTNYTTYRAEVDENKSSISNLNKNLNTLVKEESTLSSQQSQMSNALQRQKEEYDRVTTAVNTYNTAEQKNNTVKGELINKTNQQQNSINGLKSSLSGASQSLRKGAEVTRDMVQAQSDLNDSLDMMKSKIAYIFSIGNAFFQMRKVLTDTFRDIENIDKAFASIAMVTDKTISGLWAHYDEYAQMAQKLGQSTESAIKASALFYQQGLKDAEVMQLTEDTMRLATLAGLDFEKATSQMTAALRGFHMEMDQGAHVTDVYSELAAHAAADVNGIAYAMSKTASIANNAGMSFENTAAFLTQMIETTQEAPENIGTAMKTIIARFTELKKNIAGTAESEFEDLDYNKVDAALKSVGVSLKDTNGQFRNLDEVFMELSEKWNTLDRNSQRYIATIAAGSRQQSRFIAMMEDYDRVKQLVEVTQAAEGRSQEQFEKNADSIQFKLQQLKTAWEQFRLSLANSDTFKHIIDMFTSLVDTLNNLDKTQLVSLAVIGVTLGKMVISNFITELKNGSSAIQRAWKEAMGTPLKDWIKLSTQKNSFANIRNQWTNSGNYLEGARAVLGSQTDNGLSTSAEVQKTQELQKQLVIYEEQAAKLTELELKQQAIKDDISLTAVERGTLLGQLDKQRVEAEQILLEEEKQVNKLREELGYEQQITRENATQINQGLQENASKNPTGFFASSGGQAVSSIVTSGISAGLTAGLMAAISGADFGTVIKTAGISALTAAIPAILQAVMPTIISFLTGPVGIAVALAAVVVTSTIVISNAIEKAKKAELNRLAAVSDANKKMQKQNEELVHTYQKQQTEMKRLNESVENLQSLGRKKFLTKSEQTKYDSAVTYLNDNYEGLLEEEQDGHFKIVESKMDEILEEMKDDEQGTRTKLYQNGLRQFENLDDRYNRALENLTKLNDGNYKVLKNETSASDVVAEKNVKTVDGTANLYYVKTTSAVSQQKELLQELKTIYGDSLNLNDIYGTGFEDVLKTGDNAKIAEFLESNNIQTEEMLEKISKIQELVDGIEKKERDQANKTYTKQALEMQGWEEVSADIASFVQAPDKITGSVDDIANKLKTAAGNEDDFLKAIKEDNFNSGFGSRADDVKKALQQLGYGEGAKKSLDSLFSSGTNMAEWGDLTDEMRAALSAQGMTRNAWDAPLGTKYWNNRAKRKVATDEEDIMAKVIAAQMIQTDELLAEKYQQLLTSYKTDFDKFAGVVSDYNDKTWAQYSAEVENYIGSISNDDVRNAMNEYKNESENSIYKQWQGYINELSSSDVGIDKKILSKLDFKGIEYLEEQLSNLSLNPDQIKEYAKYFNNTFKDLNNDALNVLTQLPLGDLSDIGVEDSKEYIDQLTRATGNAAEAAKLYNEYISYVKKLSRQGMYLGADSTSILEANLQEGLKGLPEQFKSITEAHQQMLSNGYIDQKTYLQLIEDGFEKYVKRTSKGYELIGGAAEEAWTSAAFSYKTHIDDEIKTQKEYIEEARKWQQYGAFRFTHAQYDENGNAISTSRMSSSSRVGINYMIEEYNKLSDAEKQAMVWATGLTAEEKEMVMFLADKGYKTIEEYISDLEAGNAALNQLSDGAYLDALVSLNEEFSQAKDTVKDLKEELEDLNKTLEENKESVRDAEQAVREAYHGTELYESGLDGLINYAQKLEATNNAIEDLKENLEDVGNAAEAGNIYNKLNQNYNKKSGILSAENVVLDDAMRNLRETIEREYGQYATFIGDELNIDFAYLHMDNNDELKKAFEKEAQLYQDYQKQKHDNNKEIKKLEKEREDIQKEARDKYIKVEDSIINILKEKAKEEVDVTKAKYDAIKEADDDYLSALEQSIEKERQLRERENDANELAQKEKKLSLMMRDTSGANAKDIASLEKDIEGDRQKQLDNQIDDIINDMKTLYEQQQEARQAEIDYMEAVTENAQYFAKWAEEIMSTWTSAEDMTSWFLENDPKTQDMTVEQTEAYIDDIKTKWTELISYQGLKVTEFESNTEEISAEMTRLYQETSENIGSIGTYTQAVAEKAAQDAQEAADKAKESADEALTETQKKIAETEQKLAQAEQNAQDQHDAAMDAMVKASQSSLQQVSTYATGILLNWAGIDVNNPEEVNKWAKENHKGNGTGEISTELYDALSNNGVDMSAYNKGTDEWRIVLSPSAPGAPSQVIGSAASEAEAQDILNQKRNEYASAITSGSVSLGIQRFSNYGKHRYKNGGLVDYTGTAQVDGTPSRPEAFLDAEDTERFMTAAKLFAMSPLLNSSSAQNVVSSSVGDTSIEININVESISDDYDVDRLIKRVEDDINETARPVGTQVILNKRV